MRRLVSIISLAILLTSNSVMAGSTTNIYPRVSHGTRVWTPETDPVAQRALIGLGIWAFVRVTSTGFELFDCDQLVSSPRVCEGRLVVTLEDPKNTAQTMLEMLRVMHYNFVAVSTGDTVTIEAVRSLAQTIEPYNSEGEGGRRFASTGEYTIVTFNLEE